MKEKEIYSVLFDGFTVPDGRQLIYNQIANCVYRSMGYGEHDGYLLIDADLSLFRDILNDFKNEFTPYEIIIILKRAENILSERLINLASEASQRIKMLNKKELS